MINVFYIFLSKTELNKYINCECRKNSYPSHAHWPLPANAKLESINDQ